MKPNGAIFYRGPSRLTGRPIVAVMTGLAHSSANPKTADMLQTYILSDTESPWDAVTHGTDADICGDCKHRGDGTGKSRTCYVTVVQAPNSIYRALHRGAYATAEPSALGLQIAGRSLRLGSYGDPAAVPVDVWTALLAHVRNHTGYTHQWSKADDYKSFLMASVDSPVERTDADALGWRTFRVRSTAEPLTVGEITCPASAEAGHKSTCDRCGLCAGADKRAKSIAILAHGAGARNFVSLASLRTS